MDVTAGRETPLPGVNTPAPGPGPGGGAFALVWARAARSRRARMGLVPGASVEEGI